MYEFIYMKNRIIKFTLKTAPPYRPFANINTHTKIYISKSDRGNCKKIRKNFTKWIPCGEEGLRLKGFNYKFKG